jgi:superfamily II DNA/RNA helicase
MDKPELLARVLQARGRGLTIVFCQTKRACDRVAEDLTKRGFAAAAVHGDLGQGQRERALRAFRAGKIDVLVATDVAARGLDVDDVTHVINYECPDAADTYVHRIGRTGRAGKEGISVTLVDWKDLQRWKLVNAALGMDFAEPAETYSTSEHLYEALDIPAGITGTLPRAQRERAGLEAEEVEDIGETGRNRSPHRTEHRAEPPARKPRKRNRTRQRTRGGQPLEADADATGTEAEAATAPARKAPEKAAASNTDKAAEPAERTRPARRRAPRAADTDVDGDNGTTAETRATPPVRREAPTSATPAGVPVVEFMAPPVDPAAAELTHPSEAAQSKAKRRRRTRSGGARR